MEKAVLTSEQKVLLHLISKGLNARESSSLTKEELQATDWLLVAKESYSQSVVLMAFEGTLCYKNYIAEDIYEKWKKLSFSVVNANYKAYQSQTDLVNLLEQNNFGYIILKGASASAYYENMQQRVQGDVDFLISPDQKQLVENLLIENGYQKSLGDHPNHYVFKKDFANLEMHFEVAGVPFGWRGEKVKEFLSNAISDVKIKEQELGKFNAPSEKNHALILLLHMQHHMLGEGLGLRHLCDWASFVNKTATESFWEKEVIPFLQEIGLLIYAKAMTKTCSIYLNSVCPPWADDVDENLCQEIICDVFLSGNFGSKDANRATSSMLISQHGKAGTKHGKVYNLVHGLHRSVLQCYPVVKKVWILYPFLYLYRGLRFVFLSLIGKRPSIIKMLPQAKERKKIYDKLKVFDN